MLGKNLFLAMSFTNILQYCTSCDTGPIQCGPMNRKTCVADSHVYISAIVTTMPEGRMSASIPAVVLQNLVMLDFFLHPTRLLSSSEESDDDNPCFKR